MFSRVQWHDRLNPHIVDTNGGANWAGNQDSDDDFDGQFDDLEIDDEFDSDDMIVDF